MSLGLGLLLSVALHAGCGGEEPAPVCAGATPCATLLLSAPEIGPVTLEQLEVVVHVGERHRRMVFREQVLRLPLLLPLPMPEMAQSPGQRAALYLRASLSEGAATVALSGELSLAGDLGSEHSVALRRSCAVEDCPTPGERRHGAMAFDPVSRRVVLFGGARGEKLLGDSWTWDGGAWQLLPVHNGPAPRAGHAMTYDPQRGRLILFGGAGQGGEFFGDLWEYAGGTWREIAPLAPGPTPRRFFALSTAPSVDAGAGPLAVLLFGGASASGAALGDSWLWHGQIGRWIAWDRAAPSCAEGESSILSPRCRAGAALSLSTGRAGAPEAILIGGVSGRSALGAVYDDRVWRWDGRGWSVASVQHPPSVLSRFGHRLVAMGATQLLLTGGDSNGVLRKDSFVLDLNRGLFLPHLGVTPAARAGAAATLDEERGEVVLSGGEGAAGELGDTWLFRDPDGWTALR